jgi:hypothetical protein
MTSTGQTLRDFVTTKVVPGLTTYSQAAAEVLGNPNLTAEEQASLMNQGFPNMGYGGDTNGAGARPLDSFYGDYLRSRGVWNDFNYTTITTTAGKEVVPYLTGQQVTALLAHPGRPMLGGNSTDGYWFVDPATGGKGQTLDPVYGKGRVSFIVEPMGTSGSLTPAGVPATVYAGA